MHPSLLLAALRDRLRRRRAAAAVEYAILLTLVAAVGIGAVALTGDRLRGFLDASQDSVGDGVAGLPFPGGGDGAGGGLPPEAGQGVWAGDGAFVLTPGAPVLARTFTLTNVGDAPLAPGAPLLSGAGAAAFVILSSTCGALPPGDSCDVVVQAAATGDGAAEALLSIGGVPGGLPLSMTASGFAPLLGWSGGGPLLIDGTPGAGPLPRTAQQVLVLTNQGSADATGVLPVLSGPDAAAFSLTTDCTATLPPAASCTITVTVAAAGDGVLEATLAAGGPASVSLPLSATASGFEATLSWTTVPSDFALNTTNGGVAQPATAAPGPAQTATLTNSGTLATGPVTVALAGPDAAAFTIVSDACTGQPLAPSASCTLDVALAPGLFPGDYSLQLTASASPTVSAPARTQRVVGPRLQIVEGATPAFQATWTTPGPQTSWSVQNIGNAPTGPMAADLPGDGGLTWQLRDADALAVASDSNPSGLLDLAPGEGGSFSLGLRAGQALHAIAPLQPGPNIFSGTPALGGVAIAGGTVQRTYTGVAAFSWSGGGTFDLANPASAPASVDRTFILTNAGNIPAAPPARVADGTGPGHAFSIASDGCAGQTLSVGQTCTVGIRAIYTDSGPAAGTLSAGAAVQPLSGAASGCIPGERVFTVSGTFNAPGFFRDCGTVRILVVGGGGGGGSGHLNEGIAGGGGGSGLVATQTLPASAIPTGPIPVTVGAGGRGSIPAIGRPFDTEEQNGASGGVSAFGLLVGAAGGARGITGACWWGLQTCDWVGADAYDASGVLGLGGGSEPDKPAGSAGGGVGFAGASNGGGTPANGGMVALTGNTGWTLFGANGQGPFPVGGFLYRSVAPALGGPASMSPYAPVVNGVPQTPNESFYRGGGGGGGVTVDGAVPAQPATAGTAGASPFGWQGDAFVTIGGSPGAGFGAGGGGGARQLGGGGQGASGVVYLEWRP